MPSVSGRPNLALAQRDRAIRRLFEPALLPIYWLIALLGAVVLATVATGQFSVDVGFYIWVLCKGAALLLLAYVLRWAGSATFARFADAVEIIALAAMLGVLTVSCSAVFAATNWPRADALLARIDFQVFGFDRIALSRMLAPHGFFLKAMILIYNSFIVSWHLLLVSLVVTHRARQMWIVFTAMAMAPCIALLIFPFLPAYGTPPYTYGFADTLTGLRAGTLRQLGPDVMTGIITFPSLHAAAGALLAWAFLPLGRWAWPFVALNLLMIVSAVVVGGHYLVDILAGLALAWLSVRIARGWIAAIKPVGAAPALST